MDIDGIVAVGLLEEVKEEELLEEEEEEVDPQGFIVVQTCV